MLYAHNDNEKCRLPIQSFSNRFQHAMKMMIVKGKLQCREKHFACFLDRILLLTCVKYFCDDATVALKTKKKITRVSKKNYFLHNLHERTFIRFSWSMKTKRRECYQGFEKAKESWRVFVFFLCAIKVRSLISFPSL